jgi:aspartyl protease family protein
MKKWLICILVLVIILSFKPNYPVETKNSISTINVSLNDSELYPIERSYFFEHSDDSVHYRGTSYFGGVYLQDETPYCWADTLPYDETNISKNIPIVLRTMDNDKFNFKEYLNYHFKHMYHNPIMLEQHYTEYGFDKSRYDYDILHALFNSKICRETLFNFFLQIYSQNKYPESCKKNHHRILDNCLVFLSNYQLNRAKYLKFSELDVFSKLGSFNSFLFRRIETDKIPIEELKNYLQRIKNQIKSSPIYFSSYKNVEINNGDIIISDEFVYEKGVDVVVWNKKSNKEIRIKKFYQVKCLKENLKNYYLITSDYIYGDYRQRGGALIRYTKTLVDSDLNVLDESKVNFDVESDTPEVTIPKEKPTNLILMKKKNGVYYIPAEVNGYSMEFVFDTGASSVSISLTEAMLLYKNGKLSKSDILGSQYFSDANGDISEGTKINIRSIKIGSKLLQNIEATVVHNLQAPLLLGQSALSKFGKFSVNTANNTITFD